MATLPPEQVTQRTQRSMVAYGAVSILNQRTATGETAWAASTSGTTVTLDKDVAADQKDRATIDSRVG